MVFSLAQLNDIIGILRRHKLVFIAEQLGLNYLSQTDKDILTAAGVDLTKYTNSQGQIEHAYLFGLLSEALGDKRAKAMTYAQFQKFIKSGNFIPLTDDEEFALEQLKNRAYTDLNSLGNRIATGTSNIIIKANQTQQNKLRNIVKKKAITAVEHRQTAAKLASELGHATDDWERDWLRIAYYLLHEAYNTGRAKSIFKEHGEDAEVWFDVLEKACIHCRELYLTDPDDIDSEPIVFKLKDVIANGSNIGRKVKDWKATVGPIHPYCFNSSKTRIYTSKGWKKISEIKVGDLVLTHKRRFKQVTQVFKRKYSGESVYHLNYKIDNKKNSRRISFITGNHPILTTNGWKTVEELKITDKIFIETLVCSECNNSIPVLESFNSILNKGLCINCHRRTVAEGQWQNPNFRQYMHDAVTEEMAIRYENMSKEERIEFTKKARKEIKRKYPNGHPWMIDAIKKANKTNGKKKTFIERKLLYFCEQLGIKTITNLCLKRGDRNFRNNVSCYFPDIFIPSLGIILEADGIQWHKDKIYDKNRDEDIKEYFGFDTYRFSEKDILENGEEVFEELNRLFNNHSGNYRLRAVSLCSIEKVKKNSKCNYLYNFSVEDDESYIADGIVVHNCRCTLRYKEPNREWDRSTHSFSKVKKYVPKNKKLQGVKLNIKISKSEENDLEKAHQVGDIHPQNPNWVWTEYAPGKFDWRTNKKKENKSAKSTKIDELREKILKIPTITIFEETDKGLKIGNKITHFIYPYEDLDNYPEEILDIKSHLEDYRKNHDANIALVKDHDTDKYSKLMGFSVAYQFTNDWKNTLSIAKNELITEELYSVLLPYFEERRDDRISHMSNEEIKKFIDEQIKRANSLGRTSGIKIMRGLKPYANALMKRKQS